MARYDTEAENLPQIAAEGPCHVLRDGAWRKVERAYEYSSPLHGHTISIRWADGTQSICSAAHTLTVADDACEQCGLPGHTYREYDDAGEWDEDCAYRPRRAPLGRRGAAALRAIQ
jgi:hypothetical protein